MRLQISHEAKPTCSSQITVHVGVSVHVHVNDDLLEEIDEGKAEKMGREWLSLSAKQNNMLVIVSFFKIKYCSINSNHLGPAVLEVFGYNQQNILCLDIYI